MRDIHSNASPQTTQARSAYNTGRFNQLNGLMTSATSGVWNYLLAVNGGAAAGTLAFIGAVKELAKLNWPSWALGMFLVGLILVGLVHAFIVHRLEGLSNNWEAMTQKYWLNQVEWSEVIRSDEKLVDSWAWVPWVLGWLSLILFIAGVITAAVNFSASSISV